MVVNKHIEKELDRLDFITTPQPKDMDMIFSLYKQFVNPNAPFYTSGCSCKNSIESYYKELMKWWQDYKATQLSEKIDEILNISEEDDSDLTADDFFDQEK